MVDSNLMSRIEERYQKMLQRKPNYQAIPRGKLLLVDPESYKVISYAGGMTDAKHKAHVLSFAGGESRKKNRQILIARVIGVVQ